MKKSINFLDAELSYSVEGSGIPVLLLHGFGEDAGIWEYVKPDLNKYFLIIPDLPGSGSSQMLPQEKVSMVDYAFCIAEILKEEHIDKVHFIGHSMGGYIAMEFANLYPEKLDSICLFHSSAYADDAEKIETRRKAIDFINTHGVSPFLQTSIPGLFKDPEKHQQVIQQLLVNGGRFSGKALTQYYEAMINRNDHSAMLQALKFPILFIIGEHDKAVPIKLSLKQCYLPPVSFVHILRSSAHMGMCEEPDKVTIILHDFLKMVTRG